MPIPYWLPPPLNISFALPAFPAHHISTATIVPAGCNSPLGYLLSHVDCVILFMSIPWIISYPTTLPPLRFQLKQESETATARNAPPCWIDSTTQYCYANGFWRWDTIIINSTPLQWCTLILSFCSYLHCFCTNHSHHCFTIYSLLYSCLCHPFLYHQ